MLNIAYEIIPYIIPLMYMAGYNYQRIIQTIDYYNFLK